MRAAIFVVDDQKSVAESTATYLRAHGHDVRVETEGWAAVDVLLSDEEFDVTFLDVLMPIPTGNQIYNILKDKAPARLNRLVFYTGIGHLAAKWLKSTGLPIVDKGDVHSPQLLLQWVKRFSELSCSRGPHFMKDKKQSIPDLTDLIGDDDAFEDSDDDTGVFSASIRESHHHGDQHDTVIIAAVKYVHAKNRRLSKRVKDLEKKLEDAKDDNVEDSPASRIRKLEDFKNKLIWISIGASLAGGGSIFGLIKLLEKAASGH